jgi:hypothetical protein
VHPVLESTLVRVRYRCTGKDSYWYGGTGDTGQELIYSILLRIPH